MSLIPNVVASTTVSFPERDGDGVEAAWYIIARDGKIPRADSMHTMNVTHTGKYIGPYVFSHVWMYALVATCLVTWRQWHLNCAPQELNLKFFINSTYPAAVTNCSRGVDYIRSTCKHGNIKKYNVE